MPSATPQSVTPSVPGKAAGWKYVIISPVRDEEKYIEQTIQSVLHQTILPVEWIIVNDGSSDRTAKIIEKHAAQQHWITPVHRKNRGARKSGSGVMEAFYDGYTAMGSRSWDFLVKLDGDLSFASDYFARCLERFALNPRLGVGGGVIAYEEEGSLKYETAHNFHVRGATKIYRRGCWEAIHGLIRETGWDTVDEVKANMLGWESRTFEDIPIIQHRKTGAADGWWRDNFKNGRGDYICGYHPLFMFLKCVKRFFQVPYAIGSLGLASGYVGAYLQRLPRVEDDQVIRYLRKQQINRLIAAKSIWK